MSSAHILQVIETLGCGGAERLIHTYLKRLDSQRFRSTIVTVFSDGDHWAEPIRALGVPVISLGCRRRLGDLIPGMTRLRRLLETDRPDLIHTHLWWADIVGRLSGGLTGVPVVSSVHNSTYEPEVWQGECADIAWHKRIATLMLDRWTARLVCKRLIAVSRFVQRSASRHLGFPLDRIDLLYNPVDVDEIRAPAVRGRAEVLRDLGLSADDVILLHIGRVSSQKGLVDVIRAMPEVIRRHPRAYLVSAGGLENSHWVAFLRAEAESLGVTDQVRFLGSRRDVPDLLRACDLFVFPSLSEGLGLALIEAMAVGCACIATAVGPIPEVVRHGVDGWLVRPGDAAGLATAIGILLDAPARRTELGGAAAVSALSRFQPQAAADRLAEIYESVMAPAGRGSICREGSR